MKTEDISPLSQEIDALIKAVATEAVDVAAPWQTWLEGSDYA